MDCSVLANSAQKVLDKISDVFSVFDFSYIITGGVTFLLLYVDATYICGIDITIESTFLKILIAVFLSYFCGLVVWTVGRYIRNKVCNREKDFDSICTELKSVLGKDFTLFNKDEKSSKNDITMKVRFSEMWSSLQIKTDNILIHNKLRLINRYWVMQAVFEGLIGVAIVTFFIYWHYIISESVQLDFEQFSLGCNYFRENAFTFILTKLIHLMIDNVFWCWFICQVLYFVLSVIFFFCAIRLFAHESRRFARTHVIDLITLYFLVFCEQQSHKENLEGSQPKTHTVTTNVTNE